MGRMGHVDVVAATPLQHLAHAKLTPLLLGAVCVLSLNSTQVTLSDATRRDSFVASGRVM